MLENKITGFNMMFLLHATTLAADSYKRMDKYKDQIIYKHEETGISTPVFYVLKDTDSLVVLIQGSECQDDWRTNLDFTEITDEFGFHYHGGFYNAAKFVLSEVKQFIEEYDGTIYIIGHSYGGAVTSILHVLASRMFPGKDINSVAYDPAPAMETAALQDYGSKLATISFNHDIVSSLSILNVMNTIDFLDPLLKHMDEEKISKAIRSLITKVPDYQKSTILVALYEQVDVIVSTIKGIVNGTVDDRVQYLQGCIYQIPSNAKSTDLETYRIDQTVIDDLNLALTCAVDHFPECVPYLLETLI